MLHPAVCSGSLRLTCGFTADQVGGHFFLLPRRPGARFVRSPVPWCPEGQALVGVVVTFIAQAQGRCFLSLWAPFGTLGFLLDVRVLILSIAGWLRAEL